MTPLTDTNMAQETTYETPTFDPRGAFAWTLRGGEMARLECLERQNEVAAPRELGDRGSNTTWQTNGTERRYETPTFDPRGAFARTLRGGEIARLERQRRLSIKNARTFSSAPPERASLRRRRPVRHNTESRVVNWRR